MLVIKSRNINLKIVYNKDVRRCDNKKIFNGVHSYSRYCINVFFESRKIESVTAKLLLSRERNKKNLMEQVGIDYQAGRS